MKRARTLGLTVTIMATAALSFATARPAAAWPDGGLFVTADTSIVAQPPATISDGANGALILWRGMRQGFPAPVVQHLRADGTFDPHWPAEGRAMCAPTATAYNVSFISDGAGGAIVSWGDSRTGSADVYAQHVLANGALDPAWPADGRAMIVSAYDESNPSLTSDGAGGAIVVWEDRRASAFFQSDIYGMHVFANGTLDPAWPSGGRGIAVANERQLSPAIIGDGAGGAIVAWLDRRAFSVHDVYAQHVNANGTLASGWTPGGNAVRTGPTTTRTEVRLATDGAGGAYIWFPDIGASTLRVNRVMRMRSNGTLDAAWPPNGIELGPTMPDGLIARGFTDGTNGLLIAWPGSGNGRLVTTRVTPAGVQDPAWPGTPAAVAGPYYEVILGDVVTDGANGLIVTGHAARSNAPENWDLIAGHATSLGLADPVWPLGGADVCKVSGVQRSAAAVPAGTGAAIVVWVDFRVPASPALYAQRVDPWGQMGEAAGLVTALSDLPNDQGGRLRVSWNASPNDVTSNPVVTEYELYRGDGPDSATTWQLMGTMPARQLAGYSMVIHTTSDSGAGAAPTRVKLHALTAGARFWWSSIMTGWSRDNLAPLAPTQLTGGVANGVVSLAWGRNGESDLAGYRVYGANDPATLPLPERLLASVVQPEFNTGAPLFRAYRITAVDIHGNESPSVAIVLPEVAGVEPGALALSLSHPQPSPAAAATTLRFSLPAPSRVRLAVFDANGRRVVTLRDGELAAGEHASTWDLRDARGGRVAPGLYFVRLNSSSGEMTRRVIVLD